MEKKKRRSSKRQDWIASALLTVIGVGVLVFTAATTPRSVEEDELRALRGVPDAVGLRTNVKITSTSRTLWFHLDDHHFSITNHNAGFHELLDAVRERRPLTVYIHPDPPHPLFDGSDTAIYKILTDGETILSYSAAIAEMKIGLGTMYGIGGAMLLAGVLGGFWCYRRRAVKEDESDVQKG